MDRLHFVAQYLLGHESMDGDQFAAAMKDDATVEELERIAAEKEEQSRRENEARAKAEAEKAAKQAEGNGGLPPLDQLISDLEAENAADEANAEAGQAPDETPDGAPEEPDETNAKPDGETPDDETRSN